MKNFFLALIIIVFLFIVFGQKEILYDMGSTFRQGIDAIKDGYNGKPRLENER